MPALRVILLAAAAAATPVLLGGCAGSAPNIAAAPAPRESPASLVADTTAAPAETLHVVAPDRPAPAVVRADCLGNPIANRVTPDSEAPVVVYDVPARGTDLRDLLDRGIPAANGARVDVLVTRDPEVLAYAAQLGDYRSVALPWDRTYLLVAPRIDSGTVLSRIDQRDSLASDAVQADVRGARLPFWWQNDSACATGPARVGGDAPRIVGYPAGDAIARQLAERIVAIAAMNAAPAWLPASLASTKGGPLRTAGFAPVSLNNALASGQIAAFVAGYPHARPADCNGAIRIPAGATLVPLVDSRAHALVRRGSGAAFYMEGDGSLRFVRRRAP